METDTIVGIATAVGEGGIAIVRLSGPDAVELFRKVFVPAKNRHSFQSHRLMYGHVAEQNRIIDEAMGVVMLAPNSYTREDVCEIHTHGGNAAAVLTVKLLIRCGARPAEPGEFTRRAFMNGRIDLAQAEAVMGVISAQSEAALRAQEEQLSGGQSRFVREIQQRLLAILSGLEAHIDYPDEISEEEATEKLEEGLRSLISDLKNAIDERSARIVREGLRVALCGIPNAGKSTLFNALIGEDRAIVTDIPGTTRDVLEGTVTIDGVLVVLQDTAGLRDSMDAVEKIGVERAQTTLRNADAALLLIDASCALTDEEEALLRRKLPCPTAVILSKEDTTEVIRPEQLMDLAAGRPIFSVSAKQNRGLEQIRHFFRSQFVKPGQMMLTHERHMSVAREALSVLEHALESLRMQQPLDLTSVDLHEALYLLGRITGENVDEKLLDEVFSHFCVGK